MEFISKITNEKKFSFTKFSSKKKILQIITILAFQAVPKAS